MTKAPFNGILYIEHKERVEKMEEKKKVYKITITWEGEREFQEDFDSEEKAVNYGYDVADGCASCHVEAELLEDYEVREKRVINYDI